MTLAYREGFITTFIVVRPARIVRGRGFAVPFYPALQTAPRHNAVLLRRFLRLTWRDMGFRITPYRFSRQTDKPIIEARIVAMTSGLLFSDLTPDGN